MVLVIVSYKYFRSFNFSIYFSKRETLTLNHSNWLRQKVNPIFMHEAKNSLKFKFEKFQEILLVVR